MEIIVSNLNKKLSVGEIPITEFLIDYLFGKGYMELSEYKKYINNNNYIPTLSLVRIPINDVFETQAERYRIIEEKDNLFEININFFT